MSGHIGTGNCDKHGHYVSTLGCPRCLAKGPLDGSPLESVVQGRTESPVPENPAVQGTPAIAILMDELKDWRAGVEWLKERKLDFRCEMASVKALERAIRRITAGDTKSSSAGVP